MALPEPKKNRIRTKSAGHLGNGHSECQYRMTTHPRRKPDAFSLPTECLHCVPCYLPLQPNSPPACPHSPPLFFARCHARTHECAARHASAAASRRARGVRVAIAFRGVLPRPASMELQRMPLCCLPCSSRLTKWTSQATATPRARLHPAMPSADSVIP